MKKILFAMLMLVFVAPAMAQPAPQEEQGKYLNSASARLVKLVNAANEDGYKFENDKFAIGGGWLRQGKDNWVSLYVITLSDRKTYQFLAAGDMDAKDVDLQVTDYETGKVLAADKTESNEVSVGFTPPATGRFLVKVRLYASRNSEPSFCLAAVMERDRSYIPKRR